MTNDSTSAGSATRPIAMRIARIVGAIVIAVLALLGLYLLLAAFMLHGSVNERSLAESVSGSANSAFGPLEPCEQDGRPGLWKCTVGDKRGSGSADYRVTVRNGNSCWDAELVNDQSETGMPHALSGCVRRIQSPF